MSQTLHFEQPIEQTDIALGSGKNLAVWTMEATAEPPILLDDLHDAIRAEAMAEIFAGENPSWGYQITGDKFFEKPGDDSSSELWVSAFTIVHIRPRSGDTAIDMQTEAMLHLQGTIAPFVGQALGADVVEIVRY